MRASAPRLGGGGAMDSLFPGYKDKLWAQVPPTLQRYVIQRNNASFESHMQSICVSEKNQVGFFRKYVADALAPSYKFRKVGVDVRRQYARGTFILGKKSYVPAGLRDRLDMSKAENVFTPFSEAEINYRKNFRSWQLSLGGLAVAFLLWQSRKQEPYVVYCGGLHPPHPPHQPWYFQSAWNCTDVPSVRRGYEVYRKVCATCHSMVQLHFRHLVNEVLPERRMKQIAAQYDVVDGPNEQGDMYVRPGTLIDAFPSPFPNDEAARYANNGAVPPDLSNYVCTREDGPDYIFALLTGYHDPPEGVNLRPGLYYNTYFEGGAIGMPPPLADDLLEYEDGTPATHSQLAKDVTHFIVWASEPIADDRKRQWLKAMSFLFIGLVCMGGWYRFQWINLRTRRIDFTKAVIN